MGPALWSFAGSTQANVYRQVRRMAGDSSLNVIIAKFSVSLIRGTHVADNLRRLGVRDRERAAERLSSAPAGYYPTANVLVPRKVRRVTGWGFGWCAARGSNPQRQSEPFASGPLKQHERRAFGRFLHPLHCLEHRALCVPGAGLDHLLVDVTDREDVDTVARGEGTNRGNDLVPAAPCGQSAASEPEPAAICGGTAVRIRRHHLHRDHEDREVAEVVQRTSEAREQGGSTPPLSARARSSAARAPDSKSGIYQRRRFESCRACHLRVDDLVEVQVVVHVDLVARPMAGRPQP